MGVSADSAPKNGKSHNGKSHNGKPGAEAKAAAREIVVRALWDAFWSVPSTENRNLLVESYQHLVHDLVRRFSNRLPRTVDRGDLGTAGNVGLISAITGFDPERGVRFESYCEMRIRGALLDELRAQDWLPRPWRQRIEAHKRTREELRTRLSRRPRDEEVAQAMNMDLREYELLFGTGLPGLPAGSMPGTKEPDGAPAGLDVVPDTKSATAEDLLSREEILRLVAERLTEQEYRILYLKYWEDLPMREIGELMSLSESRVCKIHARLLERLKERLRQHSSG